MKGDGKKRGDTGGYRGLLPSSDTVLLLSRDVTAMSFGDQSMCVSRRFCAAKKIPESDSVARHSSVAIKQGEIYTAAVENLRFQHRNITPPAPFPNGT